MTRHDQVRASQKLLISRAQLFRLVKLYRERPVTDSLVLRKPGPNRGERRLSAEVEDIIRHRLEVDYFRREQPTVAFVARSVAHDCRQARLPPPSRKAIAARILDRPAAEATAAREGSKVARSRHAPVRRGLRPENVLDLVQIDHTKVDVQIVDSQSRAPIGRPWLTLVLDVASRVVLGFTLSLDAPSTNTVAQAVSQAVLPKDQWLHRRQINLLWPVYGLPGVMHLDNGAEFRAAALRRGCQQFGIDLQFRPPGRPHFGGHIERLMGTLMQRLHSLPGTTFSNVTERRDYKSEQRATLSFAELERIIALEILGPYHHEVHATLHKPPIAAWSEGLARSPPRLPADVDAFVLEFLPSQQRVVRRDGIHLFNLTYFDGALALLIDGHGLRRTVRYDPADLSAVFLQMPDGSHLRVPYANLERPSTTLWEHRAATKALIEAGRAVVDEEAIFQAVEDRRRVLAAAASSSKAARRSIARIREGRPADNERLTSDAGPADDDARVPDVNWADCWKTEPWP